MSGAMSKMRRSKRTLALVLAVVFLAGWFSFAYYQYSNQILVISIWDEIVSFQPTAFELDQARLDGNVKAVILDFNTPGGGAYASMEIADHVKKLAKVKLVIAVMEDYCASGGYYIASFADYIFTHSNTVTGSIGVIAIWTDMSEYYKKLGIKIWNWTTGPEKDLGADYRSPTPDEWKDINASVYYIFQTLLTNIEQNRNLSEATMNIVKTGATFSGSDAVLLNLADKVGNIIDAIEYAVEITGMWKFIIVFPDMDEKQKFLSALL